MAEILKELRALPDEEVIRRHDQRAPRVEVSTDHYLQKLARRDQDRQTAAMLSLTRWITGMTAVVTLATVTNLALFFLRG